MDYVQYTVNVQNHMLLQLHASQYMYMYIHVIDDVHLKFIHIHVGLKTTAQVPY